MDRSKTEISKRLIEIDITIATLNKSRLPFWIIENKLVDLKAEKLKLKNISLKNKG
jgi:hypothetical protein